MKIRERKQRQLYTKQKIRHGYRNTVKCSKNPAEKYAHRIMKFMICNQLWEYALDFQTEVTFDNNERADIIIEEWKVAIEILSSESIQRFNSKTYPFTTIPVKTREQLPDILLMLQELRDTQGTTAGFYRKRMIQKYT